MFFSAESLQCSVLVPSAPARPTCWWPERVEDKSSQNGFYPQLAQWKALLVLDGGFSTGLALLSDAMHLEQISSTIYTILFGPGATLCVWDASAISNFSASPQYF